MVIKNDAQYREYKNTMETILPMRSMNGRQPIIHCPVKYPR